MQISQLNTAEFFAPDEVETIIQFISAGKMDINDIRLLVKSALYDTYNSILNALYNLDIIHDYNDNFSDYIIYRDTVEEILTTYDIKKNLFQALKRLDYISTCGAGYIFNYKPLRLSNEEYNRLEYLIFDLMLVI